MQKTTIDNIYKWNIYLYLLTVLLLSALHHFLYELLPSDIVATFSPKGESLAEHTKIVFYPVLFWWSVTFLAFRKAKALDATKWFTASFISALLSVGLLVALYSTIFFGFGIENDNFVLHILIELLSLGLAGWIGHHYFKFAQRRLWLLLTIGIVCIVVAVLMIVFTFVSVDAPIFMGN